MKREIIEYAFRSLNRLEMKAIKGGDYVEPEIPTPWPKSKKK